MGITPDVRAPGLSSGGPVESRRMVGYGSLLGLVAAAVAPCADWVVLSADHHVWTWRFYVYWHAVQTDRWDEASALRDYRSDGALWLQFIRDALTVVYLHKSGFERIPSEEAEQAATAFVRGHAWGADLDAALLRQVMDMVLWVRSYRDRIFRPTVLVPSEQVRQRYEQAYPDPADRPPWERVYDTLYQTLLDEAVAREFPRWQDRLRQSLSFRVHPFPDTLCGSAP